MNDQVETFNTKANVPEDVLQPRIVALLFADWASYTADGKVVLAGVYDRMALRPEQFGQPIQIFVYIKMAHMHEGNTHASIIGPEGNIVAGFEIATPTSVVAYDNEPVMIQIMAPVFMIFPVPGLYTLTFTYQGQDLPARFFLPVHLMNEVSDVQPNP